MLIVIGGDAAGMSAASLVRRLQIVGGGEPSGYESVLWKLLGRLSQLPLP